MPHRAPASIPQISYAAYAYASSPRQQVAHSQCDRSAYTDDLLALRVHLRSLLKRGQISKPVGFPFHSVPGSKGRPYEISYASYEFAEYLYLDPRTKPHCATFSYAAPNFASRSSSSRMMTWRISIPARESIYHRHAPGQLEIAHVEVDPLVMETPFGFRLMTEPHILLEALAISVELGILVDIQIANSRTPQRYPTKRGVYYEPGEVIFIAVDNNGRSEVVSVFEHDEMVPALHLRALAHDGE
ncbi:hypothetical protein NLJ89_g1142 [Agrocybe chaxingu]|uniref:Uncharacterized protein n=1 Tax=Agrocybe chaxingu TaxID=84603 RepID=A0A9W8N0L9_9AGAR|nr:hypothetical protein NLJ89_g1142 [Agrocybe chaxingu]